MVGITAFGGYVPRLRLQRRAIAAAHAWMNPNALAGAKGERSMANWDEDSVTMAVEAGRDCLTGIARETVDGLYLASTTLPFKDRLSAGIVASALALEEAISACDVADSQRAGTTALMQALAAVSGGMLKAPLVVASDHRRTRAASAQELQFGDGAAALLLGRDEGIAEFLGAASLTLDFVDHFRGADEDFDYQWEERWIRDEGYSKIVPRAIAAVLAKTGIAAGEIAHFVMPCLFGGLAASLAKGAGIRAEAVRDALGAVCGETGAAHPLVMLVHALQTAKPGDLILMIGFGQGCDALIFRASEKLSALPPRRGIEGALADRREESNYMKFLTFRGLIEWEKGMRAEKDNKTALTTLYRNRDMLLGLIGGKCRKCGTAQFPRARICVNPNCGAVDTQEPYDFAELPAKILSWSADYLTFSMDPPQYYGLITFSGGGRFMTDFTDCEAGAVESGMDVRMAFRIKDFDERRGFRRYFWKAIPVPR